MGKIRIVIVHENPLFRAGLRSTLERCEQMQIIGETVQREQILEFAATKPDVVLFDGTLTSCLPTLSAAQMVAQVRKMGARGIIVFAPSREEQCLFHFLVSGAAAYVPPTISGRSLLEKIERVAMGEYLITSAVLRPAAWLADAPERPWREAPMVHRAQQQPSRPPSDLTNREIAILREVMKGQSNKQIARGMEISPQTAKNHITSILKKLGAHDRTEAVVIALRRRFISLEDIKSSDLVLDQEALALRAQRFVTVRVASRPAAPLPAVVALKA